MPVNTALDVLLVYGFAGIGVMRFPEVWTIRFWWKSLVVHVGMKEYLDLVHTAVSFCWHECCIGKF